MFQECCDTAGLCQTNRRSFERKTRSRCLISTFRQKGGFALLDIPSAGIRDALVVFLKEEKQVRFHSTYTASHEVIY